RKRRARAVPLARLRQQGLLDVVQVAGVGRRGRLRLQDAQRVEDVAGAQVLARAPGLVRAQLADQRMATRHELLQHVQRGLFVLAVRVVPGFAHPRRVRAQLRGGAARTARRLRGAFAPGLACAAAGLATATAITATATTATATATTATTATATATRRGLITPAFD